MKLPSTRSQLENLLKEAEMQGYYRGRQEEMLAQKRDRIIGRQQALLRAIPTLERVLNSTELMMKSIHELVKEELPG